VDGCTDCDVIQSQILDNCHHLQIPFRQSLDCSACANERHACSSCTCEFPAPARPVAAQLEADAYLVGCVRVQPRSGLIQEHFWLGHHGQANVHSLCLATRNSPAERGNLFRDGASQGGVHNVSISQGTYFFIEFPIRTSFKRKKKGCKDSPCSCPGEAC
jgi:hypothetical protein